MFSEGLWDKIFVTGTIIALGRALGDDDFNVRTSMVIFCTTAVARGVLRCYRGTFLPKYLQAVFGTRYLSLGPPPHLDMH